MFRPFAISMLHEGLLKSYHPFLASLGAVGFFMVLIGLVILPIEIRDSLSTPRTSITNVCLLDDGQSAVSLYWSTPMPGREGWRHHVAWHHLDNTGSKPDDRWTALCPRAITRRPQSSQILVGCFDRGIYAIDPHRPSIAPELIGRDSNVDPELLACTPDGDTLLAAGPWRLNAWNIKTKSLMWWRPARIISLAVHPSGRSALCGTPDGELLEFDLSSGDELGAVVSNDDFCSLQFSPDGRLLALVEALGKVRLLNWPALSPAWHGDTAINGVCGAGSFVAFSPSGDALVTRAANGRVAIWCVRTGQLKAMCDGHARQVLGAAFLDQNRLCCWGTDGTIRIWDCSQATGRLLAVRNAI